MFQEVKYFLEDHWLKVLIVGGILLIIIVLFNIFGGQSEEEEVEETNETGLVTDTNYGTKAEDAQLEAEFEEEGAEVVEEVGTEDNTGTTLVGKQEDIEYEEGQEFQLENGVELLVDKYKDKNTGKVIKKYEHSEDVAPEGDILRNKLVYTTHGSDLTGCLNNNIRYKECVLSVLTELKWLSGDMSDELEKSYRLLGESIANQNVGIQGMEASYTSDNDLTKVVDAFKLALEVRATIFTQLGSMEALDAEGRAKVEEEVKVSIEELGVLEHFIENYWEQEMVADVVKTDT